MASAVSAASGTLAPAVNSVCEFGTLWFPDRSFLGSQSVANLRGWLHIAGFTNWCVPTLALTNAGGYKTFPQIVIAASANAINVLVFICTPCYGVCGTPRLIQIYCHPTGQTSNTLIP